MFRINIFYFRTSNYIVCWQDSYVLNYFGNLSEYLHVGAPVYFVVEDGLDYTTKEGQDVVCGGTGCPEDSVVGQISTAAKQAN